MKLVGNEHYNFPHHYIVDLVLAMFIELVVLHDKICFEMGPFVRSCCQVVPVFDRSISCT